MIHPVPGLPSTGASFPVDGLYERCEQTGRIFPVLENDEDPDLLSLEMACYPDEFDMPTWVEADMFDDEP